MATDPQESIRECIIVNVKDTLAAIVKGEVPAGGNSGYNYTPDEVERVSNWSPAFLDTSQGNTMYFISPGREIPQEKTTGKQFRSELEIFVLACRLTKRNSEDPFRRDKSKDELDTIRNRVLKDAIRSLTEDFGRGRKLLPLPNGNRSLATNTDFTGFRIDAGEFLPWVCVELALLINYDFFGMEP